VVLAGFEAETLSDFDCFLLGGLDDVALLGSDQVLEGSGI
jgi:hypothetical protein